MMQNTNIPLMILSLWMRCLVGGDEREPNGLAMDELLGWIQIALLPCSRSCDHCYHYHGVIIITSHQHTVISRVIPGQCGQQVGYVQCVIHTLNMFYLSRFKNIF